MPYRLLACGLISLPLVCAGCTTEAEPTTPAPPSAPAPATGAVPAPGPAPTPAVPAELLARGMAAWETGMCAKCHGDTGKGGNRAPDLTDDTWQHCDGTEAGILTVLRSGVPKEEMLDPSRPYGMNPATNLVPDEADLAALATYVRSLSG